MTDQAKAASPVGEDDAQPDDLLYEAWCVIANAVGWNDDTEWRRAAIRWRDHWHATSSNPATQDNTDSAVPS